MALSCTISEIKRDIGRQFFVPPAFDAPLGGPRRNIALTFGTEILEWYGYSTVKKFVRLGFSTQYRRDRRTSCHSVHVGRAYAEHRAAKT